MDTVSRRVELAQAGFLAQVLRFGMVGVAGAAIDYGSLMLMVSLGTWRDVARVLSFILGSTTAYLLNRRWTFASQRTAREAGSVAVSYALTLVLITVINAIALRTLPDSAWQTTLAWVMSQGVGTSFNFLVQRTIIFQPDRARHDPRQVTQDR